MNPRRRKWIVYTLLFIAFICLSLIVLANRFVEPILRERIHTLIINGTDSLYTYKLGKLSASFFGGSVELHDMEVQLDSNRFKIMAAQRRLPSMTMEFKMDHGHLHGVGVFALIFGKKVSIREIFSRDAQFVLLRHTGQADSGSRKMPPLWKAIRPAINSIAINRIRLDGIKMLYKTADTSQSIKLQFDTCNAVFTNIRIDSASANDTSRIGFAKEMDLKFFDLKFRSPDSTYKLKAEVIDFSSKGRTVSIHEFKIQPTLKDKESFYAARPEQKTMSVIEYKKLSLTNFSIQQFLHSNAVYADSLLVESPVISLYMDKTQPVSLASKMNKYPHQHLLNAGFDIRINGIAVRDLSLSYTERGEKSGMDGTVSLHHVNLTAGNVTNLPSLIKQNNKCIADISGQILNNSPLKMKMTFYLDSADGRFDVEGSITNVHAKDLNSVAEPLGNMKLQSFNMERLGFLIRGDDFTASADVTMRYRDLFVVIQKKDEETGVTSTKKFLTKLINRYTLESSNPGADGIERKAAVVRSRLYTQSFFGLIWRAIFTGMQDVMMNKPY